MKHKTKLKIIKFIYWLLRYKDYNTEASLRIDRNKLAIINVAISHKKDSISNNEPTVRQKIRIAQELASHLLFNNHIKFTTQYHTVEGRLQVLSDND